MTMKVQMEVFIHGEAITTEVPARSLPTATERASL